MIQNTASREACSSDMPKQSCEVLLLGENVKVKYCSVGSERGEGKYSYLLLQYSIIVSLQYSIINISYYY